MGPLSRLLLPLFISVCASVGALKVEPHSVHSDHPGNADADCPYHSLAAPHGHEHSARALPDAPILAAGSPSSLKPVIFNWTLTDMDTMLQYSPSTRIGWSNTFSGSKTPDLLGVQSIVGEGTSAHTASKGNYQVTLGFVGTGIFFLGEGEGSRLRLTVDGVNWPDFNPVNKTAPLLAFANELTYGNHTATLSLLLGEISLHTVNVQTQLLTQAPSLAASHSAEVLMLDADDEKTTAVNFTNGWETITSIGDDNVPYTAVHGQPGSSFTYSVPANSSYLYINGTSQTSILPHTYSVKLDPTPLGGSAAGLDARRSFINGVNLFMVPLDPEVSYSLTFSVTGVKIVNGGVGVHSITTYSSLWTNGTQPGSPTGSAGVDPTSSGGSDSDSDSDSGSGSSKTNVPLIAGAAVGGVVSAILIALVIAACVLLKRRKKLRPAPSSPRPDMFVTEEDYDATPFVMPNRVSLVSQTSTTPLTSTRDPSAPLPLPLPPAAAERRHTQRRTSAGASASMIPLGIMNPDPAAGLDTNTRDPAVAAFNAAQQKRAAARTSQFNSQFGLQEQDAGPMGMATVPPSYDPTWASDYALTEPASPRATPRPTRLPPRNEVE